MIHMMRVNVLVNVTKRRVCTCVSDNTRRVPSHGVWNGVLICGEGRRTKNAPAAALPDHRTPTSSSSHYFARKFFKPPESHLKFQVYVCICLGNIDFFFWRDWVLSFLWICRTTVPRRNWVLKPRLNGYSWGANGASVVCEHCHMPACCLDTFRRPSAQR